MNFDGKVVMVTGATSGIGAAAARAFAEAGAKVVLTGRNEERGLAVRDGIVERGGIAEFTAGDIRGRSVCDRLVVETVADFGRLDVLVNNAGIIYRVDAVDTTD